MRTLILFVALLTPNLAVAESAKQRNETPRQKDLRKLLALTGAASMGPQVIAQVLESFRASMPNVPATFWPEFASEQNPDELVDKVIPIYERQLSAQEVKDLIKFYESPTGKKLIKVMPVITQESMVIGQAWGRELGEKVMIKLKQKGVEKKR